MKYLLDTNAIIAMYKYAHFKARIKQHHTDEIVISALTLFELYYGAFNGSPEHLSSNLLRVESLPFAVLSMTAQDARQAAIIRTATKKQPIGAYDTLIAAQAMTRNLVLISNNTREFKRIPHLMLEDWQA